jgi:hypothetical protein
MPATTRDEAIAEVIVKDQAVDRLLTMKDLSRRKVKEQVSKL